MDLEKIINQPNVTIIDVREPNEFQGGHIEGAMNIPLGSIPNSVAKIKKMSQPIIVYCRSGMRSGQAMMFLKTQGLKEVYNGGGINQMQDYKNGKPKKSIFSFFK
jgi:phage shock protein E